MQHKDMKHNIIMGMILTFFSIMMSAVAKCVHPLFSGYELLLIFYETLCIATFIYLLRSGRLRMGVRMILTISCLMVFGISAYATLTYGQTIIHGDTAIATMLARAELKYKTLLPKTWCYANGDVWVLDTQLAVLPFSLILRDQSLARMIGSLLMMIIGAVSLYFLDKAVLRSGSWLIAIPVIFVFFFGGNYDLVWGNDHINYQASYTCWLFFIPAMIILSYIIIVERKKGKMLYAAYMILCIVCFMRGLRAIAELLVPLLLTFVLLSYMKDRRFDRKRTTELLVFLIPSLIGCAMYKVISSTHIVQSSDVGGTKYISNLDMAADNLKRILTDMFDIFGYNGGVDLASIRGLSNLVAVICCILFVFILPVLQTKKMDGETEGVRFFFVFCMIHNVEMLISTIFFNKTFPSHIMTFVLISVMLSSHYVMKYWMQGSELDRMYCVMFVMASFITAAQLGLSCRGWIGKVNEKRMITDTMIEHGLDRCKGYGTFWNIYPLGVYSDLRLDVAAIGNSDLGLALTPYEWLVDVNKYVPDERGSYILLNYVENEELGNSLEDIYGECTERFSIGENFIYVWDYDVALNDFKGRIDK